MAVMPGAHYVDAAQGSPMSRYDIVCLHTIVGYAPAHAAHFSTNAAGYIWQSRDTRYRSAANLNGNHRVIAIENEDHGAAYGSWSGSNVPPFTAAQIEAIAKICAWAYQVHGVPLVQCPNSLPSSRGIAFHRQGCDGNYPNGRVAGGEVWSSSTGKVCPGDRRIAQMPLIIGRARALAGLPGGVDEDMQADERNAVLSTYQAIYLKGGSQGDQSIIQRLVELQQNVRAVKTDVDAQELATARLETGLTEVKNAVAQIQVGGVDYDQLANLVADRLAQRLAD